MNYALILAGGSGKRFAASCAGDKDGCACGASGLKNLTLKNNLPKQFYKIGSKAIICHTLDKFEACTLIDKIVIVCNKNYVNKLSAILDSYSYTKINEIIEGGTNQWASVMNGLIYIQEELSAAKGDIVTVHGACCPLVTGKIIKDSIKVAKEYGACAASPPTSTTTWLVDKEAEYAEHSLQNCHVKQVQYPFSYDFDILYTSVKSYLDKIICLQSACRGKFADLPKKDNKKNCSYNSEGTCNNKKNKSRYKNSNKKNADTVDTGLSDCRVKKKDTIGSEMPFNIKDQQAKLLKDLHPVLNAGYKIYFSKGSYSNIKITTKDDLEFAKKALIK